MVDLAELDEQLDLILKIFSNLNDFMLSLPFCIIFLQTMGFFVKKQYLVMCCEVPSLMKVGIQVGSLDANIHNNTPFYELFI